MPIATNLEIGQETLIATTIRAENVGTGDGSNLSFDLANSFIIDGSFVLRYGPSSGNDTNDLTTLTNITDYSLDLDSGRILLTSAGATALGNNVLYADYTYNDFFPNSVLTNFANAATESIKSLTGKTYGETASVVEYINGDHKPNYPETNRPYTYDEPEIDTISLINRPVNTISFIYFLADPQTLSKAWNYDSGSTSYSDVTENANFVTKAPFSAFNSSPATGDVMYFGAGEMFLGVNVILSTAGVDSGSTTVVWEYYDGSSWVSLTTSESETGVSKLLTNGSLTWNFPYGWEKTSVNGTNAYYVRARLTNQDYSTNPVIAVLNLTDTLGKVFNPYEYKYNQYGTVQFLTIEQPTGARNIRVDYTYGTLNPPERVKELAIMIAGIKVFNGIMGGSYDDATSYTLGSKSVSIGEVYVNVREALNQFRNRRDELIKELGPRISIVG